MTIKFCHTLSEQMQGFIGGGNLSDPNLSELALAVSRLAAASLSERAVERKHRMLSLECSRALHAGVASLSLLQRLPRIQRLLSSHPELLADLAQRCSQMYHPVCALRSLGLSQHPRVRDACRCNMPMGSTHEHTVEAKKVVYHLDSWIQRLDLEASMQPPSLPPSSTSPGAPAAPGTLAQESAPDPSTSSTGADATAVVAAAEASSSREPPEGSRFDNLLSRYGAEQFLSVVERGVFFSLPKTVVDASAKSSAAALFGASLAIEDPRSSDNDDDDCGLTPARVAAAISVGPTEQASPHAFFRLLRSRAGQFHNVSSDEVSDGIRFEDIAVSRHEVLELDRGSSSVRVAADPLPSDRATFDYVQLLRPLNFSAAVVWSASKDGLGFVPGAVVHEMDLDIGAARELVNKLVAAGAMPFSATFLDIVDTRNGALHACAASFKTHGLVISPDGDEYCFRLQLTSAGLHAFTTCIDLQVQSEPLAVPSTAWSADWSIYACLATLHKEGWSCHSRCSYWP